MSCANLCKTDGGLLALQLVRSYFGFGGVTSKCDSKILAKPFGSVLTSDDFRSTKVLIVQVVFSPIYCNVST